MNGYIKLHRSLMDNPLWTEKPFSRGQAWVDLLMLANRKIARSLMGTLSSLFIEGSGAVADVACRSLGMVTQKSISFSSFAGNRRNGDNKGTTKGVQL